MAMKTRVAAEVVTFRYDPDDPDNLADDAVCVAEFDSVEEARDYFKRARAHFALPEQSNGKYLVDLVVSPGNQPEIEGTFETDDLAGMTGKTIRDWLYPAGTEEVTA